MGKRGQRFSNERGATIVLVAVSLTVLLGMGALAVDLGMLIKARNDAQRNADAAALAGASAYQNAKPYDAIYEAKDRAFDYIARNPIGKTFVNALPYDTTITGNRYVFENPNAVVVVLPDSEKVRVIVRRSGIGTWFSRVMGTDAATVSAKAAAIAATAGAAKCVKPFAMPDIWQENTTGQQGEDKNANRIPELLGSPPEKWEYHQTAGSQGGKSWNADHYRPYDDKRVGRTGDETGWGTSFRNEYADASGNQYWDDYGRLLIMKPNNPSQAPAPGFFQAWVMPGSGNGAKEYQENIETCHEAEIMLERDYDVDEEVQTNDNEPGNMLGPTYKGIDNLLAQDSLACWHEFNDPDRPGFKTGEVRLRATMGGPCSITYPGWESSPRVILTPLFDPELIGTGRTALKFNNLAMWFLEGRGNGNQAPIMARFMYFAKGTEVDTTKGSLVKTLRLVE